VSSLNQSQLSRLETVVRDGHDATDALHKKLASLFPRGTVLSSRDRVKAAWKNVVSLSMEKEAEDAIKRIQRLNDEITRELQIVNIESQVHLREHIDAVYRREQEVTRAELQSLRDAVLPVMTGESQTMSVSDQAVAVRLSEVDKSDLARQLCEALISHPSALRQSCDNAMSPFGKHHQIWGVSRRWSGHNACVCSKSRKYWTSRLITVVDLEYESKADHHPGCPLARYTKQSWSYTLSVSVVSLLSRTVAITFGAKCEGGGWSISPALRVFATVRRATSPLFQAFAEQAEPYSQFIETDQTKRVNRARAKFVRVHRLLLDMVASGTGSLTDRDENNCTLLHVRVPYSFLLYSTNGSKEIAHLIGTFANRAACSADYKLIPEIRDLLNLAYVAGVDAGCNASIRTYFK
jgi:hypothetical protein